MLKFIAALAALLLTACSHTSGTPVSVSGCPDPAGLPDAELLLFGEMHGSVEAPKLISDLACSLSVSRELAVGLEIPSKDQALVDHYLGSRGSQADLEKLTSSYFWQKGIDGRSSAAMLDLIEHIRELKEKGRPITMFFFDDQPETELERNVAIANGIRRFQATRPDTKIIALMGNVHAMQKDMTTNDGTLVPSGRLLEDLHPVSILVTYPTGTIWACMPTCGVHEISPRNPPTGPIGFKQGASLGGYSHSYLLPSITASPPATQQ